MVKAKDRKVVPDLRFSGFKGAWNVSALGDYLDFKNGINADKDSYGKGIKFINVLDIINNFYIEYDSIIGCVEVSKKESEVNSVTYGDILFQRSSETWAEVGQASVYLDAERDAVFGGFVIRGRRKKSYHPMFMNLLLKTSLVRRDITSRSGGSTRYNIGQDSLSKVEIFIPKMSEQKKIADFLSTVDKKIGQLTEKKALLEQYKKGVMQKIFFRQIRFKDDNGKDYPDWKEKKLGEILTFIPTNSLSRNDLNYERGKVKNIHYGDIHTRFNMSFDVTKEIVPYVNETIDLHRVTKEQYCQTGDVVIADASEDYNDVGKAIEVINVAGEKVLAGLHTFLGRDASEQTVVGFKGYLLRDSEVRKQIQRIAQGISVIGISKKNLAKVTFKLPCKEEQQKIASFLTGIDEKITSVQKQLEQTQSFKKGLLQQLFV